MQLKNYHCMFPGVQKISFTMVVVLFLCIHKSTAQLPADLLGRIDLQDTVFFDKRWKECGKANHRYFRICVTDSTTMHPQKVIKIRDHYKNGNLQMEGYVTQPDHKPTGLYRTLAKRKNYSICVFTINKTI